MGTQIHAGDNYRRVVELVQIRRHRRGHASATSGSRAPGAARQRGRREGRGDIVFVQDRPATVDPVPAGLEWDLWLGPAPARPFNQVYVPGPEVVSLVGLRQRHDVRPGQPLDRSAVLGAEAEGALDDRGQRPGAAPRDRAGLDAGPLRVPRAGDQPALTLTWYQGANKPDIWTRGEIPQWASGVLFIGDKGMLLSDYGKHVLLPEETFKDFTPPPQSIPKSLGHHEEWIHACKTGEPTTCHFDYAGLADRGESPGQRRLPGGQEDRVGFGADARDQHPGRGQVPAAVVQGRMEIGVTGCRGGFLTLPRRFRAAL